MTKTRIVFADGDDQRIYTYDFSSRSLSSTFPENKSNQPLYFDCILSDRSGNLWMSVENEIVLYLEKNSGRTFIIKHANERSHSLAADYFLDAHQDSSGTIYIGTVSGISYFNPEHQFISVYPFPDSVSHTRQYYMHQLLNCDKQNNVWFAPSYQYLLKFNTAEQHFEAYNILENLRKQKPGDLLINAMVADSDRLFFGSWMEFRNTMLDKTSSGSWMFFKSRQRGWKIYLQYAADKKQKPLVQ
ncbi:MAG: hypothetical protein IPP38_10660 [Bacteroidetes bacterium]|nr:hypothetical protein [Bacteroidota bacterium]